MKVLITNKVPQDHLKPLEGIAEIIMGPEGGTLMKREDVLTLAPELDAIINQHELQVDRELLSASPKLKVVANVAIGYNNYDLDALNEFGVVGTNVPGVFAESAADHTLCLLLSVARRVVAADNYCRSGRWSKDGFQPGQWDGLLLAGKTMGIIGFGQIGQAVAKRAQAFGMKVVFFDTFRKDDLRQRSLSDLLNESNVVSLHVPLTDETHHLINKDTLALLPPGGILLNLARGPVVKEDDLAAALQTGHLFGAGMDVGEREPELHPDLLAHPNVVFTPHIGGGTVESRKQARLVCAENVAAVLQGRKAPNAIARRTS